MTHITSLARRRRMLALLLSVAASLAGCAFAGGDLGSPGSFGPPGGFGATPGGAQDLGLARQLIADGVVPPPEAFVTEGIFSEHDLPVAGAACERTLCVRATGALAPDLEGEPAAWIQVGLSSTVDPETFERPAMVAIATVDVSGSMAWGAGPDAPGELTRSFLHALVDRLDADDDFAMVTYGSAVETPVATTRVNTPARLHSAIDALREAGSTNMEGGLRRAFELARAARQAEPSRPVRVFLFTDVQPNVGATSATEFETMAAQAAREGIGLTVLGTGANIGQEVMLAMSHLRGGNAFTMFRAEDVGALLEDSWPWMAVPIAYDLSLSVKTESGTTIARGLGFPGAPSASDQIDLEVASVFLSRRRGALLIEARGAELAGGRVNVGLSYFEPDGEPVEASLDVVLPALTADETEAHTQEVTRRSVALALMVDGMREAARVYPSSREAALEHARAAHARIEAAALATEDEALETEVALAADLVTLIENGAPQRSH